MKVVIQRPVLASTSLKNQHGLRQTKGFNWINEVFEVSLRMLDGSKSCHVLESIVPLGETVPSESHALPFIHKGYFDCHLHSIWMGLRSQDVELQDVTSLEDIVFRVKQALSKGPAFIRGHGWDESRLATTLQALPRYLEAHLPDSIPILLYRNCGHSAFANRALRRAANLEQLGSLITDRHLHQISDVLPLPSLEECRSAFLWSQEKLLREGVTSISEMSLDETMIFALKDLCEKGDLLIDVQGVFDAGRAPSIESRGPLEMSNSAAIGPLDRAANLSIRHWKRYLDGSFGSRTAWLSHAYSDMDSFGEKLMSTDQLIKESRAALLNGFHLSFHAIGDAALDQALEVGDHLQELMESRRHSDSVMGHLSSRHRLEHVQLIRDDQIEKLARQGFWMLCAQPGHRVADEPFILSRLGSERFSKWAYRAGSLLEAGVPVGLGSDAPIDTFDPLKVIGAANTHSRAQEVLSPAEALWWTTTGSRLELGVMPGVIKRGATVVLSDLRDL